MCPQSPPWGRWVLPSSPPVQWEPLELAPCSTVHLPPPISSICS